MTLPLAMGSIAFRTGNNRPWRRPMHSQRPVLAGTVAGWRLEKMIGRGRGSTVYLAHASDGTPAALKLAHCTALAAQGRAADFADEFALARAMEHPHVVRALAHGADGALAFLATEFCAGGDLARQAPPPAGVGVLLAQAAQALAALHAAGWVHRDIKPANLLLRADGRLALADFGCAARQGSATAEPGVLIGTPRYAAPEQTQGAPAEPTADVYGLGLVLYEWLCGHPARTGQTPTELLSQHLMAAVPPVPAQHAAWQPLLDAMLARPAHSRLVDGQAVLSRLMQSPPVACAGGARDRT